MIKPRYLSPDEPLLPDKSHGEVEVDCDGDDLSVDQGHGDVAVGGNLDRAVNEISGSFHHIYPFQRPQKDLLVIL